MKHFALFLIILTLSSVVTAQAVQNIPTPVTWFYLAVEEGMHAPMELDNETTMAIALQKDNQAASDLMLNSFNVIKRKIDSLTDFTILPLDELEGKVNYSRLNMPITGLKKAAKSTDYQQYMRIDISIRPYKSNTRTQSVSDPTQNGVGIEGSELNVSNANVFPQVDIVVKFAGADGKSTEKLNGRYKHDESVAITSTSLSKSGWSMGLTQDAEPIPYYYFLEKAAEDLARQFNELN